MLKKNKIRIVVTEVAEDLEKYYKKLKALTTYIFHQKKILIFLI